MRAAISILISPATRMSSSKTAWYPKCSAIRVIMPQQKYLRNLPDQLSLSNRLQRQQHWWPDFVPSSTWRITPYELPHPCYRPVQIWCMPSLFGHSGSMGSGCQRLFHLLRCNQSSQWWQSRNFSEKTHQGSHPIRILGVGEYLSTPQHKAPDNY